MKKNSKAKEDQPISLSYYFSGILVLWSILIVLSLVWNMRTVKSGILESAHIQARTAFKKDIVYRRWNADYGGVYAPVTKGSPPNPYLDVPERDITTSLGKKLTMINPAYMTRQVHELALKAYGVRGHITSLNPIRPANTPDPWETRALKSFQIGVKEASSVEEIEGNDYMRLMRPLLTEKGCLKCHAAQGYKLGDIRGGISVSIPMAPLMAIERSNILTLYVLYGLLWLSGLVGIGIGNSRLNQQIHKRKAKEEALRESEEKYRALFEQAGDYILVLEVKEDIGLVIVDANQTACEIHGYTREEFLGTPIMDLDRGLDKEHARALLDRVMSGESLLFETVHAKKDGTLFPIEVSSKLLATREGPSLIITIERDITDRKQAEEKIKASLKEKEILLREIHHRVKNNMQVIISLLRLRADKIEDKKYADMFKEGEDRIRSMSLVHEQLYQSKDFANINFDEYIKSLTDGMFTSHGVDANKIRLNIESVDVLLDLENAIPCGLIINELVSNSLKHAFPQGKEGKINIALRPFNEDEFELTVSDDGIGISEDLGIEQSDTMGLQLVKVLAEHQLNGKIDLDRTNGTQFKIKFKKTAYKPRI